jgi:hypothetical protein
MGGSAPTGGPIDYSQLSDEELISLLPTTADAKFRDIAPTEAEQYRQEPEKFLREEVKQILDTLWWRHYPIDLNDSTLRQERALRSKIQRLCPYENSDKEEFFATSRAKGYRNFLTRFYHDGNTRLVRNLDGYVRRTVINAARDLARKETGKRGPAKEDKQPCGEEPLPRPKTVSLTDELEGTLWLEGAPQESALVADQLQRLVLSVLIKHSSKYPKSGRAVRLAIIEGLSFPEVADKVLPETLAATTRGKPVQRASRARRMIRLVENDLKRMAPELEKFGIDNPDVFDPIKKKAYGEAKK